jgi:hypothetical protein
MSDIDAGVAEWCRRHLGSEPVQALFTGGNLARVHGLRLRDGREVVVKIRPGEPRQTGCVAVQRHLWRAGFPCPQPLVGPLPWPEPGKAVNVEAFVGGGAAYPVGAGLPRARAFAGLLARFVSLAPAPDAVPGLAPSPAWIDWDHGYPGVWPPADDRDDDLNQLPDTAWLDELGRAAQARLASTRGCASVVGHCDWESHNLEFRDGEPWAVHDWDSVVAAPETVIVGVAAAMWPAGADSVGASISETEDFLAAYQQARGLEFSSAQVEETWAAGLWIRSFNAKKFQLDGLDTLSPDDAAERARRAGALPSGS